MSSEITGTGATTGYTTTVICPLAEGMTNPQYIDNVTLVGAPVGTNPNDLNPGQPGVDFSSPNAAIIVAFPSTITPIIVSVSVPNTNTNVDQITVLITLPDGTVLVNETSPSGTNKVTEFPVTPLPEGSTMTVILHTTDGQPPENVTLSVIACYTPSTATTIVSTGTTAPTVTGVTPTVTISSTTELITGTRTESTLVTGSVPTVGSTLTLTPLITITGPATTTSTRMTETTSVPCVLGPWTTWSGCPEECAANRFQERARVVLNGSCSDRLNESRPCNDTKCKVCTITYQVYVDELGTQPPANYFVGYIFDSTTNTTTNISVYIDDTISPGDIVFVNNCTQLKCTTNGVKKIQTPCLEDCKYTHWCEWGQCDALCGQNGTKTRRQRLISTSPPNPLCENEKFETMPCVGDPCPCIKGFNCTCDITPWCEWSPCSKTCGAGQQRRRRRFMTESTENCSLIQLDEFRPCNVRCCPVHGRYSHWSSWSSCSRTCGGGVKKRHRQCNNPAPSCKGKDCRGCSINVMPCNVKPCGPTCPHDQEYNSCATECGNSCDTLACNGECVNPEVCQPGCVCKGNKVMGPDGKCILPKQCQCISPISNRTLYEGESDDQDPCKTYTCKKGCIIVTDKPCGICEWSTWTDYTSCSNPCNGTQSRYRTYTGPGCTENRTEEQTLPCSSDCTVVCQHTFDNGTVAQYEVGTVVSETPCNKTICQDTGLLETLPVEGAQIDGEWAAWSNPWSECDQACNGTRKRSRLCIAPIPTCGGEFCQKLPDTETIAVALENGTEILKEIETEKCNQLCFTTTTPFSTSTTTPHEECYVNNGTSDIVIQPGQIVPNPNNPCEMCECLYGSLICSGICAETEETCQEKQANDPNHRYTWIPPGPNECCGTCNKTQIERKCRMVRLRDDYIRVAGCVSLLPIGRERCTGGCKSKASNTILIENSLYNMGNSTCECCAPKNTSKETIRMACTRSSSTFMIDAIYTHIKSCSCQVCKG